MMVIWVRQWRLKYPCSHVLPPCCIVHKVRGSCMFIRQNKGHNPKPIVSPGHSRPAVTRAYAQWPEHMLGCQVANTNILFFELQLEQYYARYFHPCVEAPIITSARRTQWVRTSDTNRYIGKFFLCHKCARKLTHSNLTYQPRKCSERDCWKHHRKIWK